MENQNTLIAHPKTQEQTDALKAVLKALNIDFETSEQSPYNKEFVDKIKKGQKDLDEGKGILMTMDKLKNLCD